MSRKKIIELCGMFAVGVLLIAIWWIHYNKLNVFFTMTLAWETKDRLILTGTTNLPDGTKIWMSFTAIHGKFNHIQEFEIRDSEFHSVPILYTSQPPKFGAYTLTLQMLDPSVQPEFVQAVIGEKGQGLRGPYTAKFDGRMGSTVRLGYVENHYYLESPLGEIGRVFGDRKGHSRND